MTPARFLVIAASLGFLATASHGQQPAADREPREAAAREIARLATLDLRSAASPTPDDYQAALALFGLAHELDPANTDYIRRQIEAAHNAGDQAAVIEHTRALLLKDPADTVATLRLISALITRDHNTAESRLARYEQAIADQQLDPSIRSRLALDAALLLRERGDDKGFKDKLVLALQLDSTHKEAAALAAAYFSQRVPDDAPGRIDLLVNLLKADPLDPNIHLSIARELAVAGAYAAALRFHTNAINISTAIARPSDQAVVENRVLLWYAQGPAKVARQLSDALAVERDAAARALRRLADAGRPIDDAVKPDELFLPGPVAAIYILAADAAGDQAAAAGGMRDLTIQVDKLVERLSNPRTRGNISEQAAARTSIESLIQLNTLRLLLDLDAAKFNQSADTLRAIRAAYPQEADVLDALWELRAGRPQETITRCAPLLPNPTARMATALAHEQLGNKPLAIDLYRAVVEADPLQPAAAWCRTRIVKLGGEPSSPRAPELERLVADPRVPAWIDYMVIDPSRFLRVTAKVASREADATAYVPVRITITNQSPIPLAIGPDRPLCSRFLLVPKIDRYDLERIIRPEVIDLDQRLRLLPRESIEVDVWPTPGQSGWYLDGLANRNLRLRWRITQGFVAAESGGFRPGPMCISTETDAILLRPLAASSLSPIDLATAIAGAPLESLRRLACVTRAMVLQPLFHPDAPPPEPEAPRRGQPPVPPRVAVPPMDLKPAAGAFTLRYPNLPPVTRAMLLAIIPHSRLAPDLAALDAAARADEAPLVRCVFLMTRVTDAADEYLSTARASDDARVRIVAQSIERRLTSGAKMYSQLTADTLRGAPAPRAANPEEPGR